jgi:hypothetical protein
LNKLDGNFDNEPETSIWTEYVYIDDPANGSYIDIKLEDGQTPITRDEHYIHIYHRRFSGAAPEQNSDWDVRLYQGDPSASGSLLWTSSATTFNLTGAHAILQIPIANAENITNYSDVWLRLYLSNGSAVTTDDHYQVGFGWCVLYYPGWASGADYNTGYPTQDGSNDGFTTLSSVDTTRSEALSAAPSRDVLYDSDPDHYVSDTDEATGEYFDVKIEAIDEPDDSGYTRIMIWELRQ